MIRRRWRVWRNKKNDGRREEGGGMKEESGRWACNVH